MLCQHGLSSLSNTAFQGVSKATVCDDGTPFAYATAGHFGDCLDDASPCTRDLAWFVGPLRIERLDWARSLQLAENAKETDQLARRGVAPFLTATYCPPVSVGKL